MTLFTEKLVTLVRGDIPSSLCGYENLSPRFLNIDLNIEFPERRALEFFVPKMASGSIVLLDDYGHRGHSK
jgi:hypothetical protein